MKKPPSSPPEAYKPLLKLARLAIRPLEYFLHIEAASGILLLIAATVALVWVNSPWAESYVHFWHMPIGLQLGAFSFERSLEWFVNDVLMAIFFFVVGMEIRREIYLGELSEWRRAALPIAAAFGGMIVPAALYLIFAGQAETRSGWGVPMATDIAFAVGILTLLGKRVPAALRVLLLALAVIDDLGAIVVIALFYSSGVAGMGLLVAVAGLLGMFLLQWLGIRAKAIYVLPAIVVWVGIYTAGIHPTIAGVMIGLVTPVRAWLGAEGFFHNVRKELDTLAQQNPKELSAHELRASLHRINIAQREAVSPAENLIEILHPWVAFLIMPVFALANAGVSLDGFVFDSASIRVVTGITVGLVVGKPMGVLLLSWLALRLGIASLPLGLGQRQIVVLGVVAGIGFTMAIFIAQLAFIDPALLAAAKLGVLSASLLAGIIGLFLGKFLLLPIQQTNIAQTADEAESSTTI